MEENQIIVDVGLDAFIESLRHLQKQYELNTAALKAMKDAGEEQSDAYITLTQEQKVLRQQIASTEKAMQNEIKMQQAQEGSLVQLRAQLANLQKQYDNMSGMERMGEAGVALQKRIKALHDEVLGLEGDTGRMQRNVGNYPAAVQPLREELERLTKQLEELRAENKEGSDEFADVEKRIGEVNQSITQLTGKVEGLATDTGNVKQQMRELTENLIAMRMRGEENTEQYRQMLEQLGKMKDAMQDTNAQIKQMASDTSTLNSVLDGAKAAAGGFSAALGIMTLLGQQDSETSKEMAEAQKKLQAAIAITTGLQAVQNALQKESALMMGIAKLQALAAAKAQDAYTAATGRATIAQRIFNGVAKSNPYVLLAGLILTVVGAIYAFTKGSKEQEEQLEETNKELQTHVSLIKQLKENYNVLTDAEIRNRDEAIKTAEETGADAKTIKRLKQLRLDYLQQVLDADKRENQSLIDSRRVIEAQYQQNLNDMQDYVNKRAKLIAEGETEMAEWVQTDIDNLQKVIDAQKEQLNFIATFSSRQNEIDDERKRMKDEEAEAERQRNEKAKQQYQERLARIRKEREETTAAFDELIGNIKTLDEIQENQKAKNEAYAASVMKALEPLREDLEQLPRIDFSQYLEGADALSKSLDDLKPTALEQFSAAYQSAAQEIQETSAALESSFSSLSSIYQQMAQDETKTEEERAKAARKAKAWAKIQVAANAGAAVAKGVASAVEVGFPAAIPAMATMTATILAAIAQAKTLLAEAHEHGGVIGGKFVGATSGSDNVLMTGRRGELVLNADQQKRLYDIANGSSSSNLTASLVEALQAMPAPVLVYSELKRFENNVNILDELSNLN